MNVFQTDKYAFRIPFDEQGMPKEAFYPCVAYINESGKVQDGLFSSFIFDLSDVGNSLQEWEDALDGLFARERDLSALDLVCGDVRTMLRYRSDYKCRVYIQAPVPQISLAPFGDMNRDGITEKLLDTEDRIRAYEWFIVALERRFSTNSLPNLSFEGLFYKDISDEDEFIKGCADVLAKHGYPTIAQSDREERMNELGFDVRYSVPHAGDVAVDSEEMTVMHHEKYSYLRVFYCNDKNFLSKCAVSPNGTDRRKYAELYAFVSGASKETVTTEDAFEPEVHEVYHSPDLIVPERSAEEPIPADVDFEPVLDGTAEDRIFVEEPESDKRSARRRIKKRRPMSADKKRALIGAGVAAAVLSLAYIIKKSNKD